MSDLVQDAAAPLTVTIDGASYELPELDLYDKAALLKADRDARRATKLANLTAAGLTGEQQYLEMEDFDEKNKRLGERHWIELANSVDGQVAAIEKSFENRYPGLGKQLATKAKLPYGKRLAVIAHVCGLTVDAGEPQPAVDANARYGDGGGDAGEGNADPNPPKADRYGSA